MKKLLAALFVVGLVAIGSPAQAASGTEFTTSSESASTVQVTFTVERNHSYHLLMTDDSTGMVVCRGSLWQTIDGPPDGTTITMGCYGDTVGAYSASFTVQKHTNLTPTFAWS